MVHWIHPVQDGDIGSLPSHLDDLTFPPMVGLVWAIGAAKWITAVGTLVFSVKRTVTTEASRSSTLPGIERTSFLSVIYVKIKESYTPK